MPPVDPLTCQRLTEAARTTPWRLPHLFAVYPNEIKAMALVIHKNDQSRDPVIMQDGYMGLMVDQFWQIYGASNQALPSHIAYFGAISAGEGHPIHVMLSITDRLGGTASNYCAALCPHQSCFGQLLELRSKLPPNPILSRLVERFRQEGRIHAIPVSKLVSSFSPN